MDIIFRNFIKLLSVGAFNSKESIESMSEFKWKQLLQTAELENVSDFISNGIIIATTKYNAPIPCSIINLSKKYISDNIHMPDNNYNFRITQQSTKKFSSSFLNHKLNDIIFNEIHSIDTSTNSLMFLNKLIYNVNIFLNKGIDIREFVKLGLYLRTNGDKIDFIKIEKWIADLKMGKIINMICSYLVSISNFESTEIPFLYKYNKKSYKSILLHLNKASNVIKRAVNSEKKENKVTIGLLYSSNKTVLRQFKYFPIEATSAFISNITKSLSKIEE